MAADINFCTARKLASSVNIPFGLANSIIGYRKENGAIQEFDELMNVGRITRNIMNRIKDKMELDKSSAYFLKMESVSNPKNKSKQRSGKKKKVLKSDSKKASGPNSSAQQTTPLLRFDQCGSSPMTPGPSPMLLYTPVKIQPSDSGNNLIAQYRVLSQEQPVKNHVSSALSSFSSTRANAPSINKINGGPKNVIRDGYVTLSPNKRKSIKSWLQTVQRNTQNRLGLQSKTTSPIKGILDRSGVIRGKEHHRHDPERSVTNEITNIKAATHNFCRPENDSPRRITKAREMHIRRSVSRFVPDIADSEEDVQEAQSDDGRNASQNLSEVNIVVHPTRMNVDISPKRRAKFTMSQHNPNKVNVDVHHYDRNSPVKASGSKPHGDTNGSLADVYETARKMLRDCDDDQSDGSSVVREMSKTPFTVDSSSDSPDSTDSSEASLLPRRSHKKLHGHDKKSKRRKVSPEHGIFNRNKSRDREMKDNRWSREEENPVRNEKHEKHTSSRHNTKEKKRHKSREKEHSSRRKSNEREISKRHKSREKEDHSRRKSQERGTRDRRKSREKDTHNQRRQSPEKKNKKRRKSWEKSVSSRRMSRKKKKRPSPLESRERKTRNTNKSHDDDREIPREKDTHVNKTVVHDSEGHLVPDLNLQDADNVLIEELHDEDRQPYCTLL